MQKNHLHNNKIRQSALNIFSDIRHRLEYVTTHNGITYINDSKATDLHSVLYSMEAIQAPITWIAGVSEHEEDYSALEKMIRYKVVNLICFGKNECSKIKGLKKLTDKYIYTDELESAVLRAMGVCKSGDVLLFSPGCSSFEFYDDYRQRGEKFIDLINIYTKI